MCLVLFPFWIQTSQHISLWFYYSTSVLQWPCLGFITHSAVAAGSWQQRADAACALDQSHSAPSDDSPSASSSRLQFGNHPAANMCNIPEKEKMVPFRRKLKEQLPVGRMVGLPLKSVQIRAKYLKTKTLQHFLDSWFVSHSVDLCFQVLLPQYVHVDELEISYSPIQHACPYSHGRLGYDVNDISHLSKIIPFYYIS